jgi:hypothetical protein
MLYTSDGNNKYTEYLETPKPGGVYYISKVERNLVSVGFTPIEDGFIGTMYYYPGDKNYEPATEEERSMFLDKDTYPETPITLYYK